jgi:hypothetical protein
VGRPLCPCQRSHFRVRDRCDTRPYFTVSDFRLHFSSPPATRRVTMEVFDPASTRVAALPASELFFITTLHGQQRKHSFYCWEGVLTAPLHSNGSYAIVACVFVAAGLCLQSRCLAMNIYSDTTISAFWRDVTISTRRPS